MSTFLLLTITGLGLAALYFLLASGLSLIFGLMDVLNFAHGAFLTVGAYATYVAAEALAGVAGDWLRYLVAMLFGLLVGGLVAALVEMVFIRRLYGRHVGQVLVTVGLLLAITALVSAVFGPDPRTLFVPPLLDEVTMVAGVAVPNSLFLAIIVAAVVYLGLVAFLRRTRYGLIVRAGVENRAMVTALGIDVRRAFTLVFVLGGAVAALGGALIGTYYSVITPFQGTEFLIVAFIVVIIGGLGSLHGSAIAAVLVGLLQQYANFYTGIGAGDLIVVLLLAGVLLVRPHGLAGRKVATA
ncbi:MAG: branched-chain amino acid ABC transporter permease [Actinomycetia bacterium]|nr:branched-chain amino acid ABC transporter permease [Actinomycetes bacterium]